MKARGNVTDRQAATAEPATRPQGLSVAVRRVAGLPVVAIRVWLRSGSRAETIPGQACVTGRMLTEGSRRRDWRRIAEDAEGRGIRAASFGSPEIHGLSFDALARDWERALEWAAELILEASFPEDRCTWVRRRTRAELESMGDRPEVKTGLAFREQLYSPHPLSRPLQGNEAGLARLTAADCASFHRRALQAGAVVTVAGQIDEAQVQRRAEELFADLGGDPSPMPVPPQPREQGANRRDIAAGGRQQAHLYLGHLTVSRDDPDLEALELASIVLGSGPGLTGRIPERIREQEGLAYSAHGTLVASAGLDPGLLVAYVGTAPETVEQAETGVREELARLVKQGIEPREFHEAQAYLLGREPFRRETARHWAELMAEAQLYGLPCDRPDWAVERWKGLDLTKVEEAVRRHLAPDRLRVTVGMPDGEAPGSD